MNDVDGVDRLLKQLRRIGQLERGKALRRGLKAAMRPAQQRARAAIPVGIDKHRTYLGREVRPGFARRSIRVVVSVSRDKSRAVAVLGVKSEAFYAVQFVELGTSRTPAHPWLRPSFEATKHDQTQALAAELLDAIQKAIRQQ